MLQKNDCQKECSPRGIKVQTRKVQRYELQRLKKSRDKVNDIEGQDRSDSNASCKEPSNEIYFIHWQISNC